MCAPKVGDSGASTIIRSAQKTPTQGTSAQGKYVNHIYENVATAHVTCPPTSSACALTMTSGVGTPLWMAPELVLTPTLHYGCEIDVYSFGVILWELLTGQTPWEMDIVDTGVFIVRP